MVIPHLEFRRIITVAKSLESLNYKLQSFIFYPSLTFLFWPLYSHYSSLELSTLCSSGLCPTTFSILFYFFLPCRTSLYLFTIETSTTHGITWWCSGLPNYWPLSSSTGWTSWIPSVNTLNLREIYIRFFSDKQHNPYSSIKILGIIFYPNFSWKYLITFLAF